MGLCWDHPQEAEHAFTARGFPDPALAELWQRFGDADPWLGLETGDFPAWLLVADPGAATAVPPPTAPAGRRGRAYGLLRRIVTGGDGIALRRELGEVEPRLLRLYLTHRR